MKLIVSLFCFVQMVISTQPVQASVPVTVKDSAASISALDKHLLSQSITEFKALSRKEKKEKISLAKAAMVEAKKGGEADTNTLLLCILAIILPPLAVYLKTKELGTKFWISVLLTLLFWLPGVIYALLVVLNAA